ncbi:DUF4381 domain-containing protein [Thiospirillum jenense]|uniref:DUF4381 domain-containing protein n=1 Tax=Thiospirillum jenense TaxID=1653858 RepID=A0A839HE48_9GAMM|nr:DUF4381 domain-containing protein [Thiospirillum jenense]MBB1127153.1 DUF4381 domain-containing protein [Thiospirillum jenense]
MQPIPDSQLRDIHGLDAIPWWPLAPGTWVLIGIVLLLLTVLWRYSRSSAIIKHRWFMTAMTIGTWRSDARRALNHLRLHLHQLPSKQRATELSELLRRIAMARFGRTACAGLYGTAWLDWLTQHDPSGFNWHEYHSFLLTAPYAPSQPPATHETIEIWLKLIAAAEHWTLH